MARIIKRDRSIIPACDVDLKLFREIVKSTCGIPAVGAYKIGAILALSVGLPRVVETARKFTDKPLIYDHQKAGTDIPEMGRPFAETVKKCGIDALIIFPLAGPKTQTDWIQSCQEVGLPVIVGAYMTHPRFLDREGGYFVEAAVERIYKSASSHNHVADYVVPGNRPDVIRRVRELLTKNGVQPVFYAPGFITQGGGISDAAKVAGPNWHAIVGRAIYEAKDFGEATLALAAAL